MTNYQQIQGHVENKYGFIPQTAWLAEVKELCHIPLLREAPNRLGKERSKHNRCPEAKIVCIQEAFRRFEMM
jgi:hypothetical protein